VKPVLITAAFFLALAVNCIGQSGSPPPPKCNVETSRPDKLKAAEFLEKLRAAVETDDRNSVSEMVRFPLRVNGKCSVANRSAFLRVYSKIFDARVRTAIKRQRTDCIFGNWQGFMAGDGEAWFDGTRDNGAFKIIAVNNDWRDCAAVPK
jgi:hypothetical protein